MPKQIDLTNQRFGRWLVIGKADAHITKAGRSIPRWHCKCDCGNEKDVDAWHLSSGKSISCGCYAKEKARERKLKHGMTHTPFYHSWVGMVRRCNSNHKDYGGRGIKVCERWQGKDGFAHFYEDMFNTYKEGLSLDRIDVNGDYKPSNCRWATPFEQANNQRRTHYATINGEKHSMSEWCKILNLNYGTVKSRVKRKNISLEEALTLQ